ncbi:MAG: SRPBCC domain-containing protein [Bacteroidetes bacterium]|nr:MAG: SRPBCC domain-containing protein [Bacteroidota bacterium]
MGNNSLIVKREYNASIEKVWDAITNIEKMKSWYMPELKNFLPVVGFQTEFSMTHEGKVFPHIWKVTEVIPKEKISYEWRYKGYPGNSLVTFDLQSEGNKTNLTLTHSGLETFQPEKYPELDRKQFEEGWNSLLNDLLVKFLESNSD